MPKKRLILFLVIVLAVLTTARSWAGTFLSHPSALPNEQVWFKCPFQGTDSSEKIYLRLSTTGYVLPYINGRIATRASIWPSRPLNREGIAEDVIDVTKLVKKGENIIAIWYAPIAGAPFVPKGMVSVEIVVQNRGRKQVLCSNKSKWLCHLAPAYTRFNGEDFDATYPYNASWKTSKNTGIDWVPAKEVTPSTNYPIIPNIGLKPCRTVSPVKQEVNDSIATFFLPETVTGQLRITLRGTTKGEILGINGMKYKCRGGSDEQFFTRFSTITARKIIISPVGGQKMPTSMNIELIQLTEK